MGCINSTEKEAIDGEEDLNILNEGEEEKEEEEEAKEAEEGKDGEGDGEAKEGDEGTEGRGDPNEEEAAKDDAPKEGDESPMFPGVPLSPNLGKALKTKQVGGKLGKMKMKKGKLALMEGKLKKSKMIGKGKGSKQMKKSKLKMKLKGKSKSKGKSAKSNKPASSTMFSSAASSSSTTGGKAFSAASLNYISFASSDGRSGVKKSAAPKSKKPKKSKSKQSKKSKKKKSSAKSGKINKRGGVKTAGKTGFALDSSSADVKGFPNVVKSVMSANTKVPGGRCVKAPKSSSKNDKSVISRTNN